MPSITQRVNTRNAAQNENEQKVQKENASIAEAEARINDSAYNRWQGRRTLEMGQMVPAITRAAMREPQAPKIPLYQQKLETLKGSQAYLSADPKTRTAMELHVIGAEPKSPEDVASAYNKAFARFQAGIDARKRNGISIPGGGTDSAERDVADAARYMADIIHNDFVDPEKASDMALEYLRNKQKIRTSVGKEPTMTPGAMVAPPTLAPSKQLRTKPTADTLQPDLAAKLKIYAAQVNRHPEKRAQMREDLMRAYGVDPDLYVEPGP
jgi:hypothetical protein